MRMKISVQTALLILFTATLAAPGARAQHQPRTRAKSPARVVVIKAVAFQTPELTVSVGDAVVWKNEDSVEHTVTAADHSFDSGHITPNASWRFIAKKPGRYDYYCTLHPNMKATLTVVSKP